jgi:optic atrophy protein 1
MMTRAPVQVTMSEDPEHTAQFGTSHSDRIYRLDDPVQLEELRNEIERRMVASVRPGESVSCEKIALNVRGPGLRPMILVDLPGLIQHHTVGMHESTKAAIYSTCQKHISNPNAIILCVQDASRDAEGSGVADVVRAADPQGTRTIFVLTKVDLAEKMELPARKLEQILKGQRFNMKARNYFAVVTGSAKKEESIDGILKAERLFFDSSQLFVSGAFKRNAMGTENLSKAVSSAFWDLVTTSMHRELRSVEVALRKKETEWKTRFPDKHWMSRDDLLGVGRHAVLENMSRVNHAISPTELEELLVHKLWKQIGGFVMDTLYIGAADGSDSHLFNVNVENLLDSWVSHALPNSATDVAQTTLTEEFHQAVDFADPDELYVAMKERVLQLSLDQLQWDARSLARLQNVQELNLRDNHIPSREAWESTVDFMLQKAAEERDLIQRQIAEARGPTFAQQWAYWQSTKPEHLRFKATVAELAHYFEPGVRIETAGLAAEDVKALQVTIDRKYGQTVTEDFVHDTYKTLHKQHFLSLAIVSAGQCRRKFGADPEGNNPPNGLKCNDVLLFWRIQKVLKSSGNILRLEAMDYKKRVAETVRDVLDEMIEEEDAKYELIHGPRVTLAEEIEVIRMMQTKLESFVAAVDDEKRA